MVDHSLAAAVNEAGYSNVEGVGRTETSALYRAAATDGTAVEVEEFNIPLAPAAVHEVNKQAADLGATRLPGVFAPLACGVTGEGRLFVVREAAAGTPLGEVARERFATEGHFNAAEVLNLLTPAAEAIDAYAAAGTSSFVSRSITLEHMLAQPGCASAPVKMSSVGPTPQAAGASALHNRVRFIELVSDLTGQPIDPKVVERTGTCANYLRALAGEPVEDSASRRRAILPAPPSRKARDTPREEKSPSGPWPWVIAVLALLLLALAALWWWSISRGDAWEGAEAEIQQTYPDLVSERQGGKGWKGLRCESSTPEPGQEAKIRCADAETGVSVAKYTSATERNSGLPGVDKAVPLGSGACMINSFQVPGATPPAFVMAPVDHADYRILINGDNAEEDRLALPLCG